MRVIHVVPSLAARTGGTANAVLHLCRALQEAGIESPVFAPDQAGPAQLGSRSLDIALDLPAVAAACDVHLFPTGRVPRLAYAPGLRRGLAEEAASAELVHIHGLFLYPTYAAFLAGDRSKTPYVVSPHGSLDPWIRRRGRLRKAATHVAWQARLFRRAAAVHATTEEERALWPAYARRLPHFIVPMGIDVAEYRDIPDGSRFRRELGIGVDEPLVVNVGRVSRKKGIDTLIRATATLHAEGIRAHVAVVGPDDEDLTPSLRALATNQRIETFVHFVGMREGLAKLSALGAASVWALPSHTENFGIAVLEALAAGCPCVVSTEVNLAPQIAAANAGMIVSPTVEATASGLRAILIDGGLRQQYVDNSRSFASRFDWSRVGEEMLKAYETVVASNDV